MTPVLPIPPLVEKVTGAFIAQLGRYFTVEEAQNDQRTWPFLMAPIHNENGDNRDGLIGFGWKMSNDPSLPQTVDPLTAAHARIADLEAQLAGNVKRGPGRPPKAVDPVPPSPAPQNVQISASDTVGGKERG